MLHAINAIMSAKGRCFQNMQRHYFGHQITTPCQTKDMIVAAPPSPNVFNLIKSAIHDFSHKSFREIRGSGRERKRRAKSVDLAALEITLFRRLQWGRSFRV